MYKCVCFNDVNLMTSVLMINDRENEVENKK